MERHAAPEKLRRGVPVVPSHGTRVDDNKTGEGEADKLEKAPTETRDRSTEHPNQDTITFLDDDGNAYIWPYERCRSFEVMLTPAIRPVKH